MEASKSHTQNNSELQPTNQPKGLKGIKNDVRCEKPYMEVEKPRKKAGEERNKGPTK